MTGKRKASTDGGLMPILTPDRAFADSASGTGTSLERISVLRRVWMGVLFEAVDDGNGGAQLP